MAAIVLMTVNTVTVHERIDAFDEAAAEQLEAHVRQLVEQGADETDVRTLVREARRSGRDDDGDDRACETDARSGRHGWPSKPATCWSGSVTS